MLSTTTMTSQYLTCLIVGNILLGMKTMKWNADWRNFGIHFQRNIWPFFTRWKQLLWKWTKCNVVPLIVQQMCFITCFVSEQKLIEPHSSVHDRLSQIIKSYILDEGLFQDLAEEHLKAVCVQVMFNCLLTGVWIIM